MDPLGIAISARTLATYALQTSMAVQIGAENVDSADATLLELRREVAALQSELKSIISALEGRTVTQSDTGDADSQSQSQPEAQFKNLSLAINPLLADCGTTLRELNTLLEQVAKPQPPRHRLLTTKTKLNADAVEGMRRQVQEYRNAMETILKTTEGEAEV